MKKELMIIAVFMISIFVGCDITPSSVDQKQAAAQAKILAEQNRQLGLPNITNFTQKRTLKDIQEQCDRADNVLYAYTYSEVTGKFTFLGKCIGYPIPFSTQYTNPTVTVDVSERYGIEQLPQADPNGLFMPSSADASWIMLINPKTNKPAPVYVEPKVTVSPFPLI